MGHFEKTRKSVADGVNLDHPQDMTLRLVVGAFVAAAVACACKPRWPDEEPIGGKAATMVACDVGPSGRFVVSPDSVGPFAVATAAMDDIVSSCGTVSTEWESTCCSMAVHARLDYPGVHLAAQQASPDSVPRPLSRIARWDVTGDSIYIAGAGLMPTSVAGLSASFGQGWVENPVRGENDGPQAHMCAVPNVAFRLALPSGTTAGRWLADTSRVNREARVIGLVVVAKPPAQSCAEVMDSLRR